MYIPPPLLVLSCAQQVDSTTAPKRRRWWRRRTDGAAEAELVTKEEGLRAICPFFGEKDRRSSRGRVKSSRQEFRLVEVVLVRQ